MYQLDVQQLGGYLLQHENLGKELMKTETVTATVTKNDDPEKRGRIKVKSLELLGTEGVELPIWIEPSPLWGWFVVPDIGEEVAIEAELATQQAEVAGQGWLDNPRLRWTGRRYQSQQGEAPRPPNERFTEANYGKRRGFATPAGHVLLFDDTEGKEQVTLSWAQGSKIASLAFSADGSVIVENANGSLLHLDATNKLASLIDEHGNSVSLGEDAISITDTHSNSIELRDGVVTVLGDNDVLCTAGSNVVVEAGASIELKQDPSNPANQVKLGDGADSPAMRYTEWLVWAAAHTHQDSVGGQTLAPTQPAAAAGADSKVVTLK